jgi:hypothetical protein
MDTVTVVIQERAEQEPEELAGLPEPPQRGRTARFVAGHQDAVLVALLIVIVVTVQAVNIGNFPTVSDDEGTYLAQAWAVQHGLGLAHYSYWYDHPPLGWIQIAMLSWIPALFDHGTQVVEQARVIMLPVTAVAVALVYLVARRIDLPRWAAVLATIVFGLSPLSVTEQREIYLDNFAVVWMLAAFALALSPRRHLWHHIAAGFCAAVAVLSKETMIIVAPALILAVWRGSDRVTRKFSLVGFLAAFSLIGVQYVLYALLKGEFIPGPHHNSLIGALQFQLSRSGSGQILQSGSVTNMTLHWWLVNDPIIVCAGAAACLMALALRRMREIAVAGTLLVLVAARPGGYLPAMYIIQALPFFALAIAGVVDAAVRRILRAPQAGETRSSWTSWLATWFGGRNLVALLAVLLVGLVAPHWETGDETADTAYSNNEYGAASAWIRTHIKDPAHTRIVVDDALWPDMVDDGFQPGLGAIWFYKVDLDPAVTSTLPHGWRDLDYVVSTSIIRQDPNGLPTVRDAIKNSTVVASFGYGNQQIQILKVNHTLNATGGAQ